jgi:hypothetical protein
VTPGLPSWLATLQAFALVASPRLGLRHILFNMLEINVYSIINSKVFGVKIGVNFPFTIVIKKLNDCKHV